MRFRVTGTHQGGGLGIAATGRKVNLSGMTIIQFKNGRLFHGWNNRDQMGMMQQLGIDPSPVRVNQFLDKRA